MADIDLAQLDLAQLLDLEKQVHAAIRKKKATEKRAVLRDLKRLAKDRGFTLDELTKKGSGKAAIHFRDPANASNTWSGKGPRPGWVQDALNGGKQLDDLRATS